jgi:hypothetical protein
MEIDMLSISATDGWRNAHPGATIGLLELSGIDNTLSSASLDGRKRETETYLRKRYQDFARQDFLALPVMNGTTNASTRLTMFSFKSSQLS